MICFLNRVKIFTDSSPTELANTKSKLDKAGIKYIVNTTKFNGYTSRYQSLRTAAASNYGMAVNDNPTYVYDLFVHRKDVERAREVLL